MRASRVCSTPGCPTITTDGRCPTCLAAADVARGTSQDRGYNTPGHRAFRARVLRRDPICVLCEVALSTVADHYPLSRRDLQAQGQNPNDPELGRGLCAPCHNRHTASAQPGGWNSR